MASTSGCCGTRDTNHVFVAVEDQRSGESFELTVSGADALDAFHHPYAYRAQRLAPNHQHRHSMTSSHITYQLALSRISEFHEEGRRGAVGKRGGT